MSIFKDIPFKSLKLHYDFNKAPDNSLLLVTFEAEPVAVVKIAVSDARDRHQAVIVSGQHRGKIAGRVAVSAIEIQDHFELVVEDPSPRKIAEYVSGAVYGSLTSDGSMVLHLWSEALGCWVNLDERIAVHGECQIALGLINVRPKPSSQVA